MPYWERIDFDGWIALYTECLAPVGGNKTVCSTGIEMSIQDIRSYDYFSHTYIRWQQSISSGTKKCSVMLGCVSSAVESLCSHVQSQLRSTVTFLSVTVLLQPCKDRWWDILVFHAFPCTAVARVLPFSTVLVIFVVSWVAFILTFSVARVLVFCFRLVFVPFSTAFTSHIEKS